MARHRAKKYDRRTAPPDSVLLASSAVLAIDGKTLVYPEWSRAESLNPDTKTMWNACLGDERAVAIVDSWAFRFPVTIVVEVET